MNDFTKEELSDIYWHFEYYLECLEPKFGKSNSERRKELMNKIQDMIDNYCEHDWQDSKIDADLDVCVKCKKIQLNRY
jgi:hypothetical protein